jgi:uncharacterized membrane protein (UPF0127 family)
MKLWQWITAALRASRQLNTTLRAINRTRGNELAARIEVAASPNLRRKGLLGREALAPGEGLWIVPCASVHTFFMKFPIDLVYLDRKRRVRKLRRNVAPWRISACLFAYSVLELPASTISATGVERGDQIEFVAARSSDD